MCEENGAIFVLPHEVRQTRNNVLPHRAEEGANDLIGYEGEEPGDKIEVEAGAIVVFSSTSLHRTSHISLSGRVRIDGGRAPWKFHRTQDNMRRTIIVGCLQSNHHIAVAGQ